MPCRHRTARLCASCLFAIRQSGSWILPGRYSCRSYSPTLHHLKRQLNDRYQHLLATAEVYDMTPEEVKQKARFAIWYVQLPSQVFDPDGPMGSGYTWHQGASYAQMRHIVQWVTRALQAENLRQQAAITPKCELSVEYEWAETSKMALRDITAAVGSVVDSMWYSPTEVVPDDLDEEEVLATLPCPMCHL